MREVIFFGITSANLQSHNSSTSQLDVVFKHRNMLRWIFFSLMWTKDEIVENINLHADS